MWFKVDDRLHSSRKVLSLPRSVRLSAIGLWALAGSWSAHEELDGYIPGYMVAELGGTPHLVAALTKAGLWEEAEGGSKFSKWNEYQPVRADLELARAKETERKRLYRSRGTETAVPVGHPVGHQGVSGYPDPTRPDPTPITSNEVIKERPAKRGSRLSTEWLPSPASIAKAREDAPAVDHQAEHATFVDYWIAQPGQKGVKTDWDATWRNWMRRKQADVKTRTKPPTPTEKALDVIGMGKRMQAEADRKAIE